MQAMAGTSEGALASDVLPGTPGPEQSAAWERRGRAALRMAASGWFAAAVLGQLMFASYIVGFYWRAAALGHPERWNDVLATGYVAGDRVGNLVLASHLLVALAVTAGGLIQLVPAIRRAWPRFHRWNGRVFLLSAVIGSLGGLYMILVREGTGDTSQHVGLSVMALLILGFAALAWRAAVARRFEAHRRWALRLFLVANGGWFFRIGLMFWIVVNQGPVGFDPKTFTGPFLSVLAFAQFLVPLGALQLYLHAQQQPAARVKLAVAAVLGVLALVTAGGVAAATAILWWPYLR